jgi:hypothetical protein
VGLTVYKLLLRSVAYKVVPSAPKVFALPPNPVLPMMDDAPVEGLIATRSPEPVSVSNEPPGPGTSPAHPSERPGSIVLNAPVFRLTMPNCWAKLTT